jgi:hypothetical protein
MAGRIEKFTTGFFQTFHNTKQIRMAYCFHAKLECAFLNVYFAKALLTNVTLA